MFLLDTDHFGILQQRSSPECAALLERMKLYVETDFFVSIVSFHEQVQGWNVYLSRAKDSAAAARTYQRFEQILTDFSEAQVLPFDRHAAELFDRLKSQRIRIATMDLRIGCIALVHEFTLLTRNRKDFAKIPGLRVEDWTS